MIENLFITQNSYYFVYKHFIDIFEFKKDGNLCRINNLGLTIFIYVHSHIWEMINNFSKNHKIILGMNIYENGKIYNSLYKEINIHSSFF